MRRLDANTKTSRKSMPFFDRKRHKKTLPSLYAHMFQEDLHLGVMPIGGRSSKSNFCVRIEPASKEVEKIVASGLLSHWGRAYNMTEATCGFVDEAVHVIGAFGKAYYEIIFTYNQDDKPDGFFFSRIQNECIHDTRGWYWQYVPEHAYRRSATPWKKDAENGNKRGKFVWLRGRDMLVLAAPRELGGARKLMRIVGEMEGMDRASMPEFVLKDMKEQKNQSCYDFEVHREGIECHLARITKNIGWPIRTMINQRCTEFYLMHRMLMFERSKAILREYVIAQINHALARIGEKLGFEARVCVDGLHTVSDWTDAIRRLQKGTFQFAEAWNWIRI